MLNIGHDGIIRRIPEDEKEEWLLVRGPLEKLVQKSHRARRVGERGETGKMQRRDEKTGCDADGAAIITNDNWDDTQGAKIRANGLASANPQESAINLKLEPGNYTVIVTGVNGATGNALVEVFALN